MRTEEGSDYQPIIRRYQHLAAVYDRRWQAYLQRTLGVALDTLHLSGAERILDVGCGTGEFERRALARFPALQIVGIDVTPSMLAVAAKKLERSPSVRFEVASAEMLPFPSMTFDAIVSASMLQYIHQPRLFLQECARVLRPAGRLVLVDWCGDFLRSRLLATWIRWGERLPVRVYRVEEVTCMLDKVGLAMRQTGRFVAPPGYGMMWLVAAKPQ